MTEVSERVSVLVREEIELAKVETMAKIKSLRNGAVLVAVGLVFLLFAVPIGLAAIAWGLDAILTDSAGSIWVGFAIVVGAQLILAVLAFMFAWRKLRVGAPTPRMAIDEAKKIRETVSTKAEA